MLLISSSSIPSTGTDQTLATVASIVESTTALFDSELRESISDETFLAWNACMVSLQLVKVLKNEMKQSCYLPHLPTHSTKLSKCVRIKYTHN